MWIAVSRFHYRHWRWFRKTDEYERRFWSGFSGFIWPLALVGYAFAALFGFIGWAIVHPSLAETREKRRRERKQLLADLHRQIEAAEAELHRVTQSASEDQ
jgi:hypothetical protein